MKKWVHASDEFLSSNEVSEMLSNLDIKSIIVVDDAREYNPRDYQIYASDFNYNNFTADELRQLDPKDLAKIHDVRVLRKLNKDELTPMQQIEVFKANEQKVNDITIKQIKEALAKIRDCGNIYIRQSVKNDAFRDKILKLGGRVTDQDAYEIVSELRVKDYTESMLSHLDDHWNSLLMVFEYNGDHVFPAKNLKGNPVEVKGLDIYIKIDVDNDNNGYTAVSFHNPEHIMQHPFANYPTDKG